MSRSRPVLVILRALGLGDLLASVPALRALARAFPDHHRILLTPELLAPLALATGAVDEVIDTRFVHAVGNLPDRAADVRSSVPHRGTEQRTFRGDLAGELVAVNLHGAGPESHTELLALQPDRLLAFARPELGVDGAEWRPGEWEPARWVRMLAHHGIPADGAGDPTDLLLAPAKLGEIWPHSGQISANFGALVGCTVVHPGAASAARRWPVERWIAVVRAELERGNQVVVTGGPDEVDIAGAVAEGAGLPPDRNLAGRTGIAELAQLIATAGRTVSGDTGVAHLATAMSTPSIVLFGPTPPDQWGPPAGWDHHRVIWKGRIGDPHGDEPDPGLLAITADEVIDALADLPERHAAIG